jgi:hypothetical protein
MVALVVFVQTRRYKSKKTFPLVGGKTATAEKGETVLFYKQGPIFTNLNFGRKILPTSFYVNLWTNSQPKTVYLIIIESNLGF